VIASRYIQGGKTENPAVLIFYESDGQRRLPHRIGVEMLRCLEQFPALSRDDLRALQLKCNNFDIVEEILVKLAMARPGYRIKEVPFVFEKRKAGKTKRNLLLFALGYGRHACAIDENEV